MVIATHALDRSSLSWTKITLGERVEYAIFKEAFLDRFWNPRMQQGVRAEILNGKYDPRSKETVTDYFLRYAQLSRLLEPPMPVADFIHHLSAHFPDNLRSHIIVAKPNTIKEAVALLTALQRNTTQNYHNGTGRNDTRTTLNGEERARITSNPWNSQVHVPSQQRQRVNETRGRYNYQVPPNRNHHDLGRSLAQ